LGSSLYRLGKQALQAIKAITVVDAFSKFAIPIAVPSKKASVIAKALMEVISDKGPMRRLHSDQGLEFVMKLSMKCVSCFM
jgi:hypothetical protein